MTEYTHAVLSIGNQVTFDRSPLEVDGVEIITRKEQEAMRASVKRMIDRMEDEVAMALMYGDGPRPPRLK